jgi:hypothetical protein
MTLSHEDPGWRPFLATLPPPSGLAGPGSVRAQFVLAACCCNPTISSYRQKWR